jgi:hypothetical protein
VGEPLSRARPPARRRVRAHIPAVPVRGGRARRDVLRPGRRGPRLLRSFRGGGSADVSARRVHALHARGAPVSRRGLRRRRVCQRPRARAAAARRGARLTGADHCSRRPRRPDMRRRPAGAGRPAAGGPRRTAHGVRASLRAGIPDRPSAAAVVAHKRTLRRCRAVAPAAGVAVAGRFAARAVPLAGGPRPHGHPASGPPLEPDALGDCQPTRTTKNAIATYWQPRATSVSAWKSSW